MGLCRFNFRSQALERYVDVSIAYPTDAYSYYDLERENHGGHDAAFPRPKMGVYQPDMKFQTVYLIHGGGDDDSLTYRYTNAERFAQNNDVMLVTPNVANSFGVDTVYGVNYQAFISEELPAVVQGLFSSSPRREDNFIIGYAMGGNVALGTAIMHPEKYAACVDISGGIGLTLCSDTIKEELKGDHFKSFFPIFNSTFGEAEQFDHSRFDMYEEAKRHKESGEPLCKFHICCGSKEFIRTRVEGDVRVLKELGYDVSYICAEGYDHDFTMWNDYIEIALNNLLDLKRAYSAHK